MYPTVISVSQIHKIKSAINTLTNKNDKQLQLAPMWTMSALTSTNTPTWYSANLSIPCFSLPTDVSCHGCVYCI